MEGILNTRKIVLDKFWPKICSNLPLSIALRSGSGVSPGKLQNRITKMRRSCRTKAILSLWSIWALQATSTMSPFSRPEKGTPYLPSRSPSTSRYTFIWSRSRSHWPWRNKTTSLEDIWTTPKHWTARGAFLETGLSLQSWNLPMRQSGLPLDPV